MKKLILPCLLLWATTMMIGCRKKCEDLPHPVSKDLSADLNAWMTDSATLDFSMIDFDGSVIPWRHFYGTPNTNIQQSVDCVGDPAVQQVTRYRTYGYVAGSTSERLEINTMSIDDIEFVELSFNDLLARYAPSTNTFLTSQTSEGVINPSGALLGSYTVQGKTWSNVLYIDAQSTKVIYPKIWLAKGWGIIRYENQAGRAWERI
jgi:hypothetical protein